MDHDVHFGVIEERVLVEICGADREPGIVDDCELRVHVDGVDDGARAGVERTSKQAAGLVHPLRSARRGRPGCRRRRCSPLPAAPAAAGSPGSAGRQLVDQDLRDLGRPEELVLDVDEPSRSAERPNVGLEDPKVAARHGARRSSRERFARSGARSRPAGRFGSPAARRSPVTSCQRIRKCSATSSTAGPFDARARVVPADGRARRVLARVESVTGLGGEVDAADERDPVVDHDRLLVVAVQRPLLRIEPTLDRECCASARRASRARRGVRDGRAAVARPPRRARARRCARRALRAGCGGRPVRRPGAARSPA